MLRSLCPGKQSAQQLHPATCPAHDCAWTARGCWGNPWCFKLQLAPNVEQLQAAALLMTQKMQAAGDEAVLLLMRLLLLLLQLARDAEQLQPAAVAALPMTLLTVYEERPLVERQQVLQHAIFGVLKEPWALQPAAMAPTVGGNCTQPPPSLLLVNPLHREVCPRLRHSVFPTLGSTQATDLCRHLLREMLSGPCPSCHGRQKLVQRCDCAVLCRLSLACFLPWSPWTTGIVRSQRTWWPASQSQPQPCRCSWNGGAPTSSPQPTCAM